MKTSLKLVPAMLAVLGAGPAFAALSGFYDSAEQISAILSDAGVADALRQAPVDSVVRTGGSRDGALEWQVKTRDCVLTVYLRPVAPQGLGKTTYGVEAAEGCKR